MKEKLTYRDVSKGKVDLIESLRMGVKERLVSHAMHLKSFLFF